MKEQEFKAWAMFQMLNAGNWKRDIVQEHNNHSFFAYVARPDDASKGLFVIIERDGKWSIGRYTEAFDRVTDGVFHVAKSGKEETKMAAARLLVSQMNLKFLQWYAF